MRKDKAEKIFDAIFTHGAAFIVLVCFAGYVIGVIYEWLV